MKREEFNWLVDSVFVVEDEEILCTEYFARLPKYVDLEVAGKDPRAHLPDVSHHMHQCPECEELYWALLQVASSQED